MNVILTSYLVINSWTDWKRKEIDLFYTLIFIVIGMVYKILNKEVNDWSGIMPGLVLLIFSFVWSNHIGSGDGIIVMTVGWICGLPLVCELLIGGFLLAACGGGIYWVKYKKKSVEVPFVPFFFGSYILELWIQGVVG